MRQALAAGARRTDLRLWDASTMAAQTLDIYRRVSVARSRRAARRRGDLNGACGPTAADREPVQIEFFGLPGSGKTTIAREVHTLLASRDQTTLYAPDITRDHAAALPRTLARGLLIARRLPWQRASWPPVRAVAAVGQPSLRDKSKALFNTMTVAALYAELDPPPERGHRSGDAQAIWSVHLRARDGFSAARWSPLLDREAGRPRLYASVETPAATCRAASTAAAASIPACSPTPRWTTPASGRMPSSCARISSTPSAPPSSGAGSRPAS